MRHRLSSVLALALLLGLPAAGGAGPIVQDFSNEARNIFPLVGQSFTAEDPFIGAVGAFVVDFTFGSVATDTTIDYQLYAGFGNGGSLLGTRTFSGLVTDSLATPTSRSRESRSSSDRRTPCS